MFRLILIVLFVVVAAIAVMSVTRAVKSAAGQVANATQEDTMPDTVRRIAYVALIILMFGVVSGWLGAS
ncbi:hypothetical protein [Yoonia sp. 208BN28-4]|uniref:hypothetical protein n=1 Tax=Yoonia sp. 208BN28-4 TaxID=3126505 RepID=UPI0030AA81C1